MATLININGSQREYLGTSLESKPTGDDVGEMSLFVEMDTGNVFYYDKVAEEWLAFGGE